MNNIITCKEAIAAAISCADLYNNDPRCTCAVLNNGLYELEIRTTFQRYDFYVGAVSGEVLGISSEPVLDIDDACDRIAA